MSDLKKEIASVADQPQGYAPGPVYDLLAKCLHRIEELEALLREAKEKNERDVEREREVAKASYDRLLQNYTEILEKLKEFSS